MELIIYIILLTFMLVFFGFIFKQFVMVTFGGMLLIILGVDIFADGLIGTSNWVTTSLSLIFIGLGGYMFIRSGMELLYNGNEEED